VFILIETAGSVVTLAIVGDGACPVTAGEGVVCANSEEITSRTVHERIAPPGVVRKICI
jgi:hypothetical protein